MELVFTLKEIEIKEVESGKLPLFLLFARTVITRTLLRQERDEIMCLHTTKAL